MKLSKKTLILILVLIVVVLAAAWFIFHPEKAATPASEKEQVTLRLGGLKGATSIGMVKLLGTMRHRGGIRIWMVAGEDALMDNRVKHNSVTAISGALSVKQHETAQGVERMKAELESLYLTLKETVKKTANVIEK